MKLHLIQPDDNEAAPMTPARERLHALLQAKLDAAAEVKEAQGRISRLQALATAAEPVKAKLGALDAEEAKRFATWARESDSPVPAAETSARTSLLRELSEAQSVADGAARAVAGMQHEVSDAHAKVQAAEAALPVAAAHALLEELAPIAEEARAAVAAIGKLRTRGQVILRQIDGALMALPQQVGKDELQAAWVAATAAITGAFAVPLQDEAAEHEFIRKVSAYLVALRSDANAKLEG